MKAAPIVPLGLVEELAPMSNYHLVLPQYWEDERYHTTYTELANRGDHIILDNGVAEGLDSTETLSKMLEIADYLRPTEIVAPDVIGNPNETVRRTLEFLHSDAWRYLAFDGGPTPGVMAVIQLGRDNLKWDAEMSTQMTAYRQLVNEGIITVLGLSKFLPWNRTDVLAKVHRFWQNSDKKPAVHYLGMRDPTEIHIAGVVGLGKEGPYGMVRGNDTALPFSFAAYDFDFTEHSMRSQIPRSIELDEDIPWDEPILGEHEDWTRRERAVRNLRAYQVEICRDLQGPTS